jgi:polyhydroxybutyrate depolymerase
MKHIRIAIAIVSAAAPVVFAQVKPAEPPKSTTNNVSVNQELMRKTWTVDKVERTGLLYLPKDATEKETPVVFAFHGHGGSGKQAALSFHMHREWPEAIVVYLDGLPTPGALTDPKGEKNGWQSREGLQDDRDLKFFDVVMAKLKKDYKIDERRIYAMGHSNGGGFTFLLWASRPDIFAAVAPSGAFTGPMKVLKPKPVMHIAGKNDDLVKFEWQKRTMDAVKKSNGCDEKGSEWAKDCTLYPSKTGTPLVTMIYDGNHKYPSETAPALIVKFFKEQVKPADKETGGK